MLAEADPEIIREPRVKLAELGIDDDQPIRHLREYLDILKPLTETGAVNAHDETLSALIKARSRPDAEHIAPTITDAAEQVGRQSRRIIATLPVCVTDGPLTDYGASEFGLNSDDRARTRALVSRVAKAAA